MLNIPFTIAGIQTQLGHIIYTYNESCRKVLNILLINTTGGPRVTKKLGTVGLLLS